jgi:hypothetical protein
MNAPHLTTSLCALLLLGACTDAPTKVRPPEPVMPGTTTSPSAMPAPHDHASSTPALPPGHPSTTPALPPGHPSTTGLPPGQPSSAGGKSLVFTPVEGWVKETPSSAMRKAQFKLPKQGADTEDGSLVVFMFGRGEGGSVDDNIQRWVGQYEQPDGRPSKDVAQTSTRRVNGMSVTELDVSGTCVAETMPGSGQRLRKENWRTLAAIVESDHGSYFVKAMGPAATMAHWEAGFRQYVSSAR